MVRYVLFDLDGTLADTSPGILACIQKALAELGEPAPDPAVMRRFIGPPLKAAFEGYCGMPPARALEATRAFRRHYDAGGKFGCQLYPGIVPMLTSLRDAGCVLVVATSKPTPFAVDILRFLGVGRFFAGIVGSNLDNTRSSKPEVIRFILDAYGIPDGRQALMVGDKAQDLLGAQACGVRGVGVTYGFGSREELLGAPHDAILDSPGQVAAFALRTGA